MQSTFTVDSGGEWKAQQLFSQLGNVSSQSTCSGSFPFSFSLIYAICLSMPESCQLVLVAYHPEVSHHSCEASEVSSSSIAQLSQLTCIVFPAWTVKHISHSIISKEKSCKASARFVFCHWPPPRSAISLNHRFPCSIFKFNGRNSLKKNDWIISIKFD